MSEITGGLIEMNVHMIRPHDAQSTIVVAVIAMVIMGVFTVMVALSDREHKWRYTIGFAVMFVAWTVALIIAAGKPLVKESHACADGAVSLEAIAARYDIVSVDGKELVLRERDK